MGTLSAPDQVLGPSPPEYELLTALAQAQVLPRFFLPYTVSSIVQSNVELKVGCVKHNAGKNIRKLWYYGYNLTNYNSKKGFEEVNLTPFNTFDLCL